MAQPASLDFATFSMHLLGSPVDWAGHWRCLKSMESTLVSIYFKLTVNGEYMKQKSACMT